MTQNLSVIECDYGGSPCSAPGRCYPQQWKLVPKHRLLFESDPFSPGGEFWLESTVAGMLPVVLGFRCLEAITQQSFRFKSIHGPVKVISLEVTLNEDSIHLRIETGIPGFLKFLPGGVHLFRLWVQSLVD